MDDTDPLVTVMKVEKAPQETYADIGGLDNQIQEIKVRKKKKKLRLKLKYTGSSIHKQIWNKAFGLRTDLNTASYIW